MQIASHVHAQQTEKVSRWPNRLLWILLCIPVLHTLLLVALDDLNSSQALLIHQLRPIGTLGSMVLLSYVAWLSHGRRRWAWGFQALSMLFSAIFSFLRVTQNISVATSFLQVLVVLIYLCSLIGTALYLQHRSWWLGSTWRVIIGGTVVGVAALVLMRATLPIMFAAWPWNQQISTTLAYLSFDIGMLFAFSLISVRYRRNSSPLLPLVVLGLFCLLIADSLYMLLSWMPGGQPLQVIILPLYTFHAILLAFAAYRDVTYALTDPNTKPSTMPLIEWLLWVLVPLVVTIAAFTSASILGSIPTSLIVALAIITVTHEVLAMFDYQRVTVALHKARLEAADVATMRERTRIARDFHDTIGAHLSGLTMYLRGAKAVLTADPARARESIVQAQQIVKEAATDVRSTIDALRTPAPSHRSLDDLITKLIERNRAAGIPTDLRICGTPYGLSASVNEVLFRVVQEGLTNIRKHAQATQVVVELDYRDPRHVGLLIDDNGQGTDQPEGGFGFIGIQERVAQLHGTVQITTAPGQGLRLAVEVPV